MSLPTLSTENTGKLGEGSTSIDKPAAAVSDTIQEAGAAVGAQDGSSAASTTTSQVEQIAEKVFEQRAADGNKKS